MNARIKRVKRLVDAAESARNARERSLVEARRLLEAQTETLARAQAELDAGAEQWLEAQSSDELAQASARRRTLARYVEIQARKTDEAKGEVQVVEQAAVEARRDERRLEILVEGLEAGEAARRKKADQKIGDEHAARMGRNQ